MLRTLIVTIALVVVATAVAAQNLDVIKARKEALKAMGDQAKIGGAIMKGEAELDLAKVKTILSVIQDSGTKLPELFPDDSKTGGDTEALPAIWEKKTDFVERFPKLVAAAKAAQTAIVDDATFESEWPKVVQNCKNCHETYRQKK